jgi:hypothetical protein
MAFDLGRQGESGAIFKAYQDMQRKQKQAKTIATFAIPAAFAGTFLAGWIFFLVYAAIRPDAWPYIGLWSAFGLSYLFTYIVRRARGE